MRVTVPLVLIYLGQWALSLHTTIVVRDTWSTRSNRIAGLKDTVPWMRLQAIYNVVFDGLILAAAWITLSRQRGYTNLWRILVRDGLVYYVGEGAFCIVVNSLLSRVGAFASYTAAITTAFLDVDPFLIFGVVNITTILVSILACRSFVRILTFGNER